MFVLISGKTVGFYKTICDTEKGPGETRDPCNVFFCDSAIKDGLCYSIMALHVCIIWENSIAFSLDKELFKNSANDSTIMSKNG